MEGRGLNGGFYWSALLLTALPFAIVAVIGAWVGYAAWRARPILDEESGERRLLEAAGIEVARDGPDIRP